MVPVDRMSSTLHDDCFDFVTSDLDQDCAMFVCFRATVENHPDSLDRMPPVTITISNNDVDFVIRYQTQTLLIDFLSLILDT